MFSLIILDSQTWPFLHNFQTIVGKHWGDVCFLSGSESMLTPGITPFTFPVVGQQETSLFSLLRICSVYLLYCTFITTLTIYC